MIEDVNNFNVLTNEKEKQKRLDLCNMCTENKDTPHGNICESCACPIDYVIKYKFKICPLEKWNA